MSNWFIFSFGFNLFLLASGCGEPCTVVGCKAWAFLGAYCEIWGVKCSIGHDCVMVKSPLVEAPVGLPNFFSKHSILRLRALILSASLLSRHK